MKRTDPETSASIVIVGGGPRGSGLLERLVANAAEQLDTTAVVVHVVEPFTPGAGRIWRHDQSTLLWANSQAEDMTMFTDASCRIEGPIRTGPTFLEWSRQMPHDGIPQPRRELERERAAVHGKTFPSRRLLSEYLTWSFRRAVRDAPARLSVRVHAERAIDLTTAANGRQLVHLAGDREALEADIVVLAQGHLPTRPVGANGQTDRTARELGLAYHAEQFTADSDLSGLRAGEPVIVRGAGLAFIDLLVLVTQGRGGAFVERDPGRAGGLEYRASGQEPLLLVGSRRGVPYHSKITYRLPAPSASYPRFLTPEAVDELIAGASGELHFRADVWPLLAKELAFGHYHQLFAAHPEAVRGTWEQFESALAEHAWCSDRLSEVVIAAIPDIADRFDPELLDRPLAGLQFPDSDQLQKYLLAYVESDVSRSGDVRYSADLGAFNALLSALGPLWRIFDSGRLSLTSVARDVPWFSGFFNCIASGPPPRRLRELSALMRAGVVRFLGADIEVVPRPAVAGSPAVWVATSPTVAGEVTASTLIEARVPQPTLAGTADPLLAALYERGEVNEHLLIDSAGRTLHTGRITVEAVTSQIVDRAGRPHPARFALGSVTSTARPGAFSRPGTDAAFFRENDRAARHILTSLAHRSLANSQ